jgi:uncharacterized membrane protein
VTGDFRLCQKILETAATGQAFDQDRQEDRKYGQADGQLGSILQNHFGRIFGLNLIWSYFGL